MAKFEIFKYMEQYDYEQLVFFQDEKTGLKGITCIHNTVCGPALGGTRLWNYASEEEAIEDVLRLGKGMSYKAAMAGLKLGGGKTVIWGDPAKKTPEMFEKLGEYVESLNGRYITAEDVNTSTKDMMAVNKWTDHVVGLEGKSGNPSPVTAWGCFASVKASLKEKFGNDSIEGKTFAVQGAGQTGYYLIKYLLGEDYLSNTFKKEKAAKIYFTEVNQAHIDRMKREHPEVEFVQPNDIYACDVDVFCPCALGKVINDNTIPQIKASIVCGTSNNVLEDIKKHANMLLNKSILYSPDYLANGGGLINVYHELLGYNRDAALVDVEKIYDRSLEVFKIAKEENISTAEAADLYCDRILYPAGGKEICLPSLEDYEHDCNCGSNCNCQHPME